MDLDVSLHIYPLSRTLLSLSALLWCGPKLAQQALNGVEIIGEGAWLIPGGAYRQAQELLKQNLKGIVNLREETPLGKRYPGVHPKNICNRGNRGEGLQIELSSELRKQLLSNPDFLEAFSRNIADTLRNLD